MMRDHNRQITLYKRFEAELGDPIPPLESIGNDKEQALGSDKEEAVRIILYGLGLYFSVLPPYFSSVVYSGDFPF